MKLFDRFSDICNGVTEGHAGSQVKGDSDRWKLAGVIDRQGADTPGQSGNRVYGNQTAIC